MSLPATPGKEPAASCVGLDFARHSHTCRASGRLKDRRNSSRLTHQPHAQNHRRGRQRVKRNVSLSVGNGSKNKMGLQCL
jgi:hypothetical protein